MGLAEGKDDEEEAVVVETVSPPSMGLMGDGAEAGEVTAIDEDVDEADWPTLKDLFRPSDPFFPPPRLFSPLAASESEVTAPELETDGVAAVSAAGVVVAVFVAAFTERDATTSERDSFFFIPPPLARLVAVVVVVGFLMRDSTLDDGGREDDVAEVEFESMGEAVDVVEAMPLLVASLFDFACVIATEVVSTNTPFAIAVEEQVFLAVVDST